MARTDVTPFKDEEIELARKALVLRRAGFDLFEIAQRLKVTEHKAASATRNALEAAALMVSLAERRELLNLEVTRLDALQAAVWDDAMTGDVRAVEAALKLVQARSKLLGLDTDQSATSTTVVVAGDTQTYIETLKQLESSNG
ncbi:MAG TPA: hypothetical protein PLQ14_06880 [Actinomycetota bacterium]|nr:hypothetical protein [Actinomycetota bacterium]HPQ84171.1 hypothetical protein [Actinomycetota bacterium]